MFSTFKGALRSMKDRFKGNGKEKAFDPTPPLKPPVFPDKDRFILRFACAVFAVISGKFTFNVIRDFFTMTEMYELVFAGFVAAAVTALEYSALRKAIFSHSIGYMIVSGMIAVVSILGSFGAYQGAFIKNMINSFEYQSAQRQIESLDNQIAEKQLQAADFRASGQKINARDRLREADQLIAQRDDAQGGLSSAREMGASGASGNAVISSLSRWSDSNIEATADTTNTVLSIGVELIFLILTGLAALEEKRARRAYLVYYQATQSGGYVDATGAAPGAGHPETAYLPYPIYSQYSPSQQAFFKASPPVHTSGQGFKIPVGFGRGSSAISGDEKNTSSSPTPPAEKEIVYIEGEHIHTHSSDRLSIDELNRRRRLRKLERINTVRCVLRDFPDLPVVKQAEKAGMSKPTFIKYRKLLNIKKAANLTLHLQES